MDMSFPSKGYARPGSRERRDHRTLLATAIARQASGWTARAMMLSNSTRRRNAIDDVMAQRIHYFSSHNEGRSSPDVAGQQPFGSFFPQLSANESEEPKGKRDVYHSGSTIGKAGSIDLSTAELQPEHAGHGVSRKL